MKTKLLLLTVLSAVLLTGCAPTHQPALQRIADGKIQKIHVNMDGLGRMAELGWLPATASPPK